MITSLTGTSILLLIANGFNESEFAEVQRALMKTGAKLTTVSPEKSVANGWLGSGWGHYFPVDTHISDTLGSDFDMLVLAGGSRSVAKLQLNPHSKRIVGHFIDADKPVVALNEAVGLLSLPGRITGRRVAGDTTDAALAATGALVATEAMVTDRNLLTIQSTEIALEVQAILAHLGESRALAAA